MPLTRFPLLIVFSAAALLAQGNGGAPPPQPKPPSGLALSAIDKAASPCNDFYQYACGMWLKNNPIPPDQSSWGRFSELAERNREILHRILEQAAAKPTPETQQIGDYYASCMDEKQ